MNKQNLTITAFSDENFIRKVSGSSVFTAQVNPENYEYSGSIFYNTQSSGEASSQTPEFKYINTTRLSFELLLDASAVSDDNSTPVATQVDTFEKVAYRFNKQRHQPNFLIVAWNTLNFKCRLESFSVFYTLFQPDGTPLRARLKASFVAYVSQQTPNNRLNKSWPDITRLRLMQPGENLPAMCDKIYSDEHYYIKLASYKRIKFRPLKASTLIVPPIIQRN